MAVIDSLVSYWKLDEASGLLIDSHGSNDATNNGGEYGVTGKLNDAISIVLVNDDWIDCNAVVIPIGTNTAFSISCWYDPVTYTSQGYLVGQYSSGQEGRFGFSITTTGDLGVFQGGSNGANYTANTNLSTTSFHHCVLTKDTSGNIKLYANGSQTGTTQTGATASVHNGDTTIGAGGFNAIGCNGVIDEVGIWAKELSSAEVEELYNGGDGLAYPFGVEGPTLFMRTLLRVGS